MNDTTTLNVTADDAASYQTTVDHYLAEINRLLENGKLKVRVAMVLPLAEAKKAHQISATSHPDGKIILRP